MIDDNATKGNHSHTIYIGQYFSIFIIIPYYYSVFLLFMPTSSTLDFIPALPFYLDPSQRSSVLSSTSYLAISTTQHPVCRPALFITSQRITFHPGVYVSTFISHSLVPYYTGVYQGILYWGYQGVQGVQGVLGLLGGYEGH